jgi:aerobic carbon-monoxide dehydrogenase medium subunit
MKPPPFDYHAPTSLEEALALLAEHGDEAQPLAGGQTLVPMLALRVARPSVVIDLRLLGELRGIDANGSGLRLGAMTRQAEALASREVEQTLPAMISALQLVGHFQTRNRGTIGGSVALGEPAGEMPALALALDAELELRSASGTRTVAASEFYTGPYMTARADDELLTSVRYRPAAGARIGIEEVAQRRGDFALSGLVASLEIDGDTISRGTLAWLGMGSTPLRAPSAEAALAGAEIATLDFDGIAELAIGDSEPTDDAHATVAYRQQVGRTVVTRLLGRLLAESRR